MNKATQDNKNFTCFTCSTVYIDIKKDVDIKSLIKNFNLLRIAEKIETRKTLISNHSVLGKSIINESISNFDDISLYESLPADQKCKKHNLGVHSYAIGTNLLLCDKCIKETNLKTYPLPAVTKELRRKIDSNGVSICLLKSEIERLKDFFQSYQYYILTIEMNLKDQISLK